jgi:hypothetical protein
MSPILMGDGVKVDWVSKVKEVELPIHVIDVVVKFFTHYDRSISIMPDDILDGIDQSLRSL